MRKKAAITLALLILPLLFMSCDDFFSKSWGKERNYDESNIDINAGNAQDWVNRAVGNPNLAAAIIEKILIELEKELDPQDRAVLQDAGVKLAIEASGLGKIIINNGFETLLSLGDMEDNSLRDLLRKVQKDFGPAGITAAANLVLIVDKSIQDNIPVFKNGDLYAQGTVPLDVAQAILVLTLAVVGDNVYSEDFKLNDLSKYGLIKDEDKIEAGDDITTEGAALAAYLNLLAYDTGKYGDNPLTREILAAFLDIKPEPDDPDDPEDPEDPSDPDDPDGPGP